MQIQSQRMQNIVEDLLVLSKLESTVSVTQEDPIALPALIERLCNDAKASAETSIKCTAFAVRTPF